MEGCVGIKELNKPINLLAYSEKLQQAIPQKKCAEFSLLSSNLQPLHEPVTCKDYISDAFWSEAVNQSGKVYGFSWQPGRIKPKKWYNLALSFYDNDLAAHAICMSRFVNEAEVLMKLPKSRFALANGGEHQPTTCIIVTFAKAWSEKPIGLSLLTFLLRAGLSAEDRNLSDHMAHIKKFGNRPFGPYDHSYVDAADKWIKRFRDAGGVVVNQEYTQYKTMNSVHSNSGIYSFLEREL